MTTYLSNRDGGKTDEAGHNRLVTKAFSGDVLNGLQVTQNSPLAMSVLVTPGEARIPYSTYYYTVWIPTGDTTTLTITTADPSNPRIDRVIMYVDRAMPPQSVTSNNPGIPKFAVVAGTPNSSPVKASDASVNTAVSNNPWIELGTVRVNAAVTQVTNSTITDTRSMLGSNPADGSITNAKLSTTAGELGGAWSTYVPTWTGLTVGNGTLVAKLSKTGKTVRGFVSLIFGSTTSISGSVSLTTPSTMANNITWLPVGLVRMVDEGTDTYAGAVSVLTSTTIVVQVNTANATYSDYNTISATVPYTWTTLDRLIIEFTYEEA